MSWFVSVLLLSAATGARGFSVTTSKSDVRVKEGLEADLTCSYSADFGSNPRLEWKFSDRKNSLKYVVYDGKLTDPYTGRVSLYGGSNLRFSKVTREDNGTYTCEVSGNNQPGNIDVFLTVLVAPSVPMCKIPSSVTTGTKALLTCHDRDGSPAPSYKWYKDDTLLPTDPSKNPNFKNATYVLDEGKGFLEFPRAAKTDSGVYSCEAVNNAGPPQKCRGVRMDVRDMNTGGIVAGVIVALLIVVLLIIGIWYANKKGYLPKRSEGKSAHSAVYQPQSTSPDLEDDTEFRQKSSFVV